ncbi:hypothetical protein MPSEU_000503900 [Mayamaea pseudoterrestris]|nr:hypothetical protein MPSEU_000503900 [Mayamaea pseudoterrestris]
MTEIDDNDKRLKIIGSTEASVLLLEVDSILDSARNTLQKAKDLATTAELDTTSWSENAIAASVGAASTTATAGYSNTDHIIPQSGDYETDRLETLKRKYVRRLRSSQPEARGNDRWDKPKVPGERRRRIVREKDSPEAPAEPPPTGYTIFVGQMTNKIRHDRPHEPHNQPRVVQEISTYWKSVMTDAQRDEYNDFADQVRQEYTDQLCEFRATGTYTPSERFEKKPGANVWVRKRVHEKNALERELDTYESYSFPPRPAELDEAYRKREEASKQRRKLKLKGLLDRDGNPVMEENAVRLDEQASLGIRLSEDEEPLVIEEV